MKKEKDLDFERNLEKSIAGIDGQLLHLLVVFRVCSIVIAIGPQPQLEIDGMVTEHQTLHWNFNEHL